MPVNREKGATALLVAASLVMLIGFAAVAIDLSAGFNERRQGQTAADLGALAGAVEYVSVDQEGTLYQILNITRDNLRRQFGDPTNPDHTDWIAIWKTCTDTPPSGFNPWPIPASMATKGWTGFPTVGTTQVIPCISADADEIRVKLPDQLVDTTFGGVLGANSISTTAIAHARVKFTIDGGARPFGVLASASTGSLCLTTRSGSFPPCNGPDSGNFGTLNSQQWGNDPETGTTTDCGLPGNPELAVNIAKGTDHIIGFVKPWYATSYDIAAGDPYPSSVVRDDHCTILADGTVAHSDNDPSIGNSTALRADTGFNQFAATKAGLISDTDWVWENVTSTPTPLLQQPGTGVLSTRPLEEKVGGTVYPSVVDNTPLWEHLRPDDDLPPTLKTVCAKSTIAGAPDSVAAMNQCLTSYETLKIGEPATTHLFEDSIWENPRFVFVPQFHSVTWGSGSHFQPIKGFRVAYIDTIWFNCNGSFNNTKNTDVCDGSKGLTFAPDMGNDGDLLCAGPSAPANCSPLRLDQFTAFLLPANPPVSDEVLAKFPGQLRGPFEIQLTR